MELQFIDFEGGILSKMEVSLNEFTPKANLMALSRTMFDRVFLGTTLNDDQAILVLEPDDSITLLLRVRRNPSIRRLNGKYRQDLPNSRRQPSGMGIAGSGPNNVLRNTPIAYPCR